MWQSFLITAPGHHQAEGTARLQVRGQGPVSPCTASGPSSWLLPPPTIPDPQEVRCLLPHTYVPGRI